MKSSGLSTAAQTYYHCFITVEMLSNYSLLFTYDFISPQRVVVNIHQCIFRFA